MMSPNAPTRSSRWIVTPLILVIVLALAWSAGWYYAATRADEVITSWMEREAQDGRTYACDGREIAGFPFRIEVRCNGVSAQLQENAGPVVLKARQLVAVAQVYQPDLIIAEVTGPMTISLARGEGEYVAEWRLLQASVRGRPRDLRRLSIVVDDPTIRIATAAEATPLARAGRLEAHLRRGTQGSDGKPAFDLAARTSRAFVPTVPALADRPFDAEATAVLRGFNDFSAKPVKQRLRDWQMQGGRLDITRLRLQQGEAVGTATGEIGLSSQGRLDGRLNLLLAGLDDVIGSILQDGGGRNRGSIMTGIKLLGRAELEGKRAIALPLLFRDGRVFLGPVPVAQTSPLF